MNQDQEIEIMVADERHIAYVDTILDTIAKRLRSVARVSQSVTQNM